MQSCLYLKGHNEIVAMSASGDFKLAGNLRLIRIPCGMMYSHNLRVQSPTQNGM